MLPFQKVNKVVCLIELDVIESIFSTRIDQLYQSARVYDVKLHVIRRSHGCFADAVSCSDANQKAAERIALDLST